jgi:hypothetical protein
MDLTDFGFVDGLGVCGGFGRGFALAIGLPPTKSAAEGFKKITPQGDGNVRERSKNEGRRMKKIRKAIMNMKK